MPAPNPEQPAEKKPSRTDDRQHAAVRNTEAIMAHLNEYLSIRYDHAARINPKLRHMKQDLVYHEMSNVRRTLLGDKIYGPIRLMVSDVFVSDDDTKRRRLMSPSDQTSVQVELVSHCQDDKVEARRGQIRFHDLKSYYTAIDPDLVDFIDLFETWIWWDIFDAVELVRFEQKLGKIQMIRQGKTSEEFKRRYSMLIHPPSDPDQPMVQVTEDDMLRYEIGQLQYICDQWHFRHQGELGYKFVLKREELPAPYVGELIHSIASKVREHDAIENMQELDEDICATYAGDLKVAPAKVTREMILQQIQAQLLDLEREMLKSADAESRLGPPFNFKERQIEQMERWLYDLKRQFEAILKVPEPKPAPTPAAEPARPVPAPLPPPPVAKPPVAGRPVAPAALTPMASADALGDPMADLAGAQFPNENLFDALPHAPVDDPFALDENDPFGSLMPPGSSH